jgi:hypothetical protein
MIQLHDHRHLLDRILTSNYRRVLHQQTGCRNAPLVLSRLGAGPMSRLSFQSKLRGQQIDQTT